MRRQRLGEEKCLLLGERRPFGHEEKHRLDAFPDQLNGQVNAIGAPPAGDADLPAESEPLVHQGNPSAE